MTGAKRDREYRPNPHYSKEDWDEVSDNPELTEADFARMRPAKEALPPALFEAFEALAKRRPGQRGPGRRRPKVAVTLRLDAEVVDAFKSGGAGWQTRINETLKKAVGKRK